MKNYTINGAIIFLFLFSSIPLIASQEASEVSANQTYSQGISEKEAPQVIQKTRKQTLQKFLFNAKKGVPEKGKEKRKVNRNAIASFILGLVSIVSMAFPPWFIVFGLTGMIFGILALKQIKMGKEPTRGKGLAIAGLIFGFVSAFFFVGLVISYM